MADSNSNPQDFLLLVGPEPGEHFQPRSDALVSAIDGLAQTMEMSMPQSVGDADLDEIDRLACLAGAMAILTKLLRGRMGNVVGTRLDDTIARHLAQERKERAARRLVLAQMEGNARQEVAHG
jgi:hypothetical protein